MTETKPHYLPDPPADRVVIAYTPRTKLVAILVITAILSLAISMILGWVQVSQATADRQRLEDYQVCVSDWADKDSARDERRARLLEQRARAFDDLIRAVVASTDRAKLAKAFQTYLTKSNRIDNELKSDPLPESPKFACDDVVTLSSSRAPAPVITLTVTAQPLVTPTRTVVKTPPTKTVTARVTQRVPVPVVRPGPVRTVVRTVTVPPGRR
jgi:hypothetical protein